MQTLIASLDFVTGSLLVFVSFSYILLTIFVLGIDGLLLLCGRKTFTQLINSSPIASALIWGLLLGALGVFFGHLYL